MVTGFQSREPAMSGFQFIEDLSTAYWYSQVLFTAIELDLFKHLENDVNRLEDLARSAQCRPRELARLLTAMTRLGLVACHDDQYFNNPAASRFLVPGKTDYMGDFFLYRQYMRPQWEGLTFTLTGREPKKKEDLSYEQKIFNYTAAMDTLVRQKSTEIVSLLTSETLAGSVLDIGGGAGGLARALKDSFQITQATVFDLSDVIEAAQRLYPEEKEWEKMKAMGGDFRTHEFKDRFSIVCMSNFLHAYGRKEARGLLVKAVGLLEDDGMVLIHDYFPDRFGAVPQKGPLYDLNMMANTYNGECHNSKDLVKWLQQAGFQKTVVKDLKTDTSVILARRQGDINLLENTIEDLAMDLGFHSIVPIDPDDVVTTAWAREKCRYGCAEFDKGLQCPPNGMDDLTTRRMLEDYSRAYLVRGAPPGKSFHEGLLALEKKAFLEGYHKAFVFGAGPCTMCPKCPEDGTCRLPHLARPSMEGSGIDVYETARKAGIPLKPLKNKEAFVTYIGLLLVS